MPGVHLGSHTWSHPNLATLPDDEVRGEILQARGWLMENVETHANLLTYPYGSTNAGVMSAARNLGLEGAFLIRGGSADRETLEETPYAIPRLNVPRGLSPEGLLARASGVWP